MALKPGNPKWWERLKTPYRLVIYSCENFEEKTSFSLSRMNVIGMMSFVMLVMFGVSFVLLFYTPLKVYTPTYGQLRTRQNVISLIQKADSLEHITRTQKAYLENVRSLLSGNGGTYADSISLADTAHEPKHVARQVDSSELFARSEADSALRSRYESGRPGVNRPRSTSKKQTQQSSRQRIDVEAMHLMSPLSNSVLSQGYNLPARHAAIDLAAPRGELVRACKEGVVVHAEWSSSTGYVTILQHPGNLLSIYKHNARLLEPTGTFVEAGMPIAVLGSTGTFSSGPHLHFELWHNGTPLDPQDHISF